MFKGKVKIYKNVNGKEISFKKSFNNEEEYNKFINNNPDLKELNNWETNHFPKGLSEMNNYFDEAFKLGNDDFFKDIEKDFDNLLEKSKKLLGK